MTSPALLPPSLHMPLFHPAPTPRPARRLPPLHRAPRDTDPVTYCFPQRVRIGCELMRACDWLTPRMSGVTTPFIIFHSENDT